MSGFTPFDAVEDLEEVLRGVAGEQVEAFEQEILEAERIFVTGLGRTGLMARGFAMRLMHLGRRVFHVGDVITPAIHEGDLLIICSRTGRSRVLGHYVSIARRANARVAVVTGNAKSSVAKSADTVLAVDDRPGLKAGKAAGRRSHPLGSLFEQALLVVLDQVVLSLMEHLALTEEDLAQIHTTFE
ncbi:MAG: SIS domain-containing protein [Planctomycetota bacterium]|nr:SIS domain-containing protein [Planctomycetota bacterium]